MSSFRGVERFEIELVQNTVTATMTLSLPAAAAVIKNRQ